MDSVVIGVDGGGSGSNEDTVAFFQFIEDISMGVPKFRGPHLIAFNIDSGTPDFHKVLTFPVYPGDRLIGLRFQWSFDGGLAAACELSFWAGLFGYQPKTAAEMVSSVASETLITGNDDGFVIHLDTGDDGPGSMLMQFNAPINEGVRHLGILVKATPNNGVGFCNPIFDRPRIKELGA